MRTRSGDVSDRAGGITGWNVVAASLHNQLSPASPGSMHSEYLRRYLSRRITTVTWAQKCWATWAIRSTSLLT